MQDTTPYYLTVESSDAVGDGGTVYRFYANASDPTDQISAVFGTNEYNLVVNTPEGVWNSSFNTSFNASGINPAFVGLFPDLVDDSYATIGLTGPASASGITGAVDPSLVEDESLSPGISGFFINGGTSLNVNTLLGGSWYVLNTAANSYPVDGRWLIMQVTTTGSISGRVNYQIFPLGVGEDQVIVSLEFDGIGNFGLQPEAGCMDASACNYDALVTSDDGSCEYLSCVGCTDVLACNYDAEATVAANDLCVFCDCGASGSGYLLVVEEHETTALPGAKSYRLKVRMANTGDQMSAVFGVESVPMSISVPDGLFNSQFNTSWNASGITDAFLGFFPELADDSYATIGLTGPASASALAGAEDPAMVQDVAQPFTPFFIDNGSTELEINTITGGSWYNLNTASNTLPDANNEVLIMQLTTTGDVSGTVNVQVLPEGVTGIGNDVQKTFHFDGAGLYAAVGDGNACGCTDATSCNFDGSATYDDGSCQYDDALGECGGTCDADADADGICDDVDPCIGAIDACGVCNGPGAVYDCGCTEIPDGDCDCNGNVLDECGICAGNGIPEDDCDCDGNQLDALGECGGPCEADADMDGICDDVDPCVGELDACGVCNGDGPIFECGCADIPDGDCDCNGNVLDECDICGGEGIPVGDCDCNGNALDALGECGGPCDADADADGICDDIDPCVGALDACGVCNGPGAIYECGCADIPEGDCDCEGNVFDVCGACGGSGQDVDGDGLCDDDDNCTDLDACNFATVSATECDYCSCAAGGSSPVGLVLETHQDELPGGMTSYRVYITFDESEDVLTGVLGKEGLALSMASTTQFFQDESSDLDSYITIDGDVPGLFGGENAFQAFDLGQPLNFADPVGGGWKDNGSTGVSAGADLRVWVAQLTTDGEVSISLQAQILNQGLTQGAELVSLSLVSGPNDDPTDNICGCTDPSAFNYNPEAEYDNGSCIAVEEGCIDESACNFDDAANTDNGTCLYLDALGACGGPCEADADADGICDDVDPCVGELDACGVCNGPGDIYECGCADIPEGDCDCDGNVLDECGICGGDGIPAGDCDCDGNQLDALGECGGPCEADADADGICDDVDPCVGELDACGVCNGPGEIYECGCADIPEGDCDCDGNVLDECGICGGDGIPAGDCDCDGNQLDALGECGGPCEADADADGICDDVDPCVGELDACGVCNGPGEIYECGCADIPEGDCDCDGNVLDECGICGGDGIPAGDCDCDGNQLDALGECGGPCEADADADGICDDVDPCVGELRRLWRVQWSRGHFCLWLHWHPRWGLRL